MARTGRGTLKMVTRTALNCAVVAVIGCGSQGHLPLANGLDSLTGPVEVYSMADYPGRAPSVTPLTDERELQATSSGPTPTPVVAVPTANPVSIETPGPSSMVDNEQVTPAPQTTEAPAIDLTTAPVVADTPAPVGSAEPPTIAPTLVSPVSPTAAPLVTTVPPTVVETDGMDDDEIMQIASPPPDTPEPTLSETPAPLAPTAPSTPAPATVAPSADSENAPETTAPTVQGQAGQVSGTIHAPTPALNETAGDVLRGVLDNRVFMLEDQDLIQVQIRNTDGRRRLLAWSEPEELSDIDVEQVERLGPYLRGSDDDCDGVGDRFYEEDMESYTDKSGHGVGSGGKESGWARGEGDEGAEEDIGVTDSRTVGVKVGVGNKANGGLHVIGEELREEKSENEDGDVLSSPPEAAAAASGVDGFPGSSRFWTWVLSGDVDVRADDGKRQQMVGGGSRVRGGKTFLGDSSDGQEGNGDEWRRGELRDGGESGGRVSAVSKVDVGGRRKRRCSHHRRRGNEGGGISSKRWSPYHGVDSGGPGDNAMMMEMENDGGYGGGAEGGREGDFEAEMGSSTAELDPLEGKGLGVRRHLADFDEKYAEFVVSYIDDPGETAASARAIAGISRLLNSTSIIAASLGVNESDITYEDLVYSRGTTAEVYTDEALATFQESSSEISATSVVVAVAIIIAAAVASACIGASIGRCWLHSERKRRDAAKPKQPIQAAYERSPIRDAAEERSPIGGGGDGKSSLGSHHTTRPLLRNNGQPVNSSAEDDPRSNASFGRLMPSTSVGTANGGALGAGAAGDESEYGEVVEHDYGDNGGTYDGGRTESYVSRGPDGMFSEYGGQSEYGSVVPGGPVNEGALSDNDSSRYYDDDDPGWDTDNGSTLDQGSLAGYPLPKDASSRFSAGPRSQASFATPSVAASGISSVITARTSRTNFPPPGGLAGSPPYGPGGRHQHSAQHTGGGSKAGSHAGSATGAGAASATSAGTGLDASGSASRRSGAENVAVESGSGLDEGPKGAGGLPGSGLAVSAGLGAVGGSALGAASTPREEEPKRPEEPKGPQAPPVVKIQVVATPGRPKRATPARSTRSSVGSSAGSASASPNVGGASPVIDVSSGSGLGVGGGLDKGAGGSDGGNDSAAETSAAVPAAAGSSTVTGVAKRRRPAGAVAAVVATFEKSGSGLAIEEGNGDADTPKSRPSLDSAAGSVAVSSIVHSQTKFNTRFGPSSPKSSFVAGASGPIGPLTPNTNEPATTTASFLPPPSASGIPPRGGRFGAAPPLGSAAAKGDGGRRHASGRNDDDAASQYTGSFTVGQGDGRQQQQPPLRSPLGRNSQSLGGITTGDSPDSDRSSFVSRVGSYALTDIGHGESDRDLAIAAGRRGLYSPASTVVRSTGMSELGSDIRTSVGSPHASDEAYNSDSPGAQSGWERAWMRQRDDVGQFRGAGGQ